jgi:hypothetical protein
MNEEELTEEEMKEDLKRLHEEVDKIKKTLKIDL